jgi:hypothetical protein
VFARLASDDVWRALVSTGKRDPCFHKRGFDLFERRISYPSPFTGWIEEQADSQVNGIQKANEADAGSHLGH